MDEAPREENLNSRIARTTVQNAMFEVEKFDGTNNFGIWQCEVKDVLAQQDLLIALEGKPEGMSDSDWKKINVLACSTIRLCLCKPQKYFVMRESSAKELWQKLEDKYMTKNIENRLHLKMKLYRFQYKEGTGMIKHLDAFNKLIADLLNLGLNIKDEDKALILLISLPDSYDHLATTLLYGKETLNFEDVSNALMNHEVRHKDKQSSSSDALVARGRSTEKKSFNNKKKSHSRSRGNFKNRRSLERDECAFCHNKGHWKKDCPKLQKKNKTNDANAVVSEDESDFVLTVASACDSDVWVLDSGCSHHMCPNRNWFTNLELENKGTVLLGNDYACDKEGVGTIKLKLHDGVVRDLSNVWYVPDLKKNLISLGALEANGFNISMSNGGLKVTKGALVVMKGTRQQNLYFLQGKTVLGGADTATGNLELDKTRLWHMKLGHAGEKALQGLVKQGLLKGAKTCKLDFCEHCDLGKQTRAKFGTKIHQTKGILDYMHLDVWGPTKTASMGGKHWFVTFVDDFSRKVWVYTMKHKYEVLDIFLNWKKMVETQTGKKIKALRSDNDGEYTSDSFLKVCKEQGIVRHFTVRGTPQQNGVAEILNRTLLEKVRCMLAQSGLSKSFWAYVINYACHFISRLPSAAIQGKTHIEDLAAAGATQWPTCCILVLTRLPKDNLKQEAQEKLQADYNQVVSDVGELISSLLK